MTEYKTLGFIGLGVMGEPICRNLVKKSGKRIVAFDVAPEPLGRLRGEGAETAGSVADVVRQSGLLFLCLPSAKHVRAVFEGDGILRNIRSGQVVVDLGTSSVSQTRDFAGQLQAKGAAWADAPIARTRQAAQDGTLSVMVGATPVLYADIEPLIRCFATDVTHCGEVGAGQVTKILNNMVLFETVNALAEAVAVAKHNGVDPKLLLDTLSKGSADSFALRNHGMKAIVPGNFPERAFSTEYALKDLSYALELASDAGIRIRGAELMAKVLQEAIDAGSGNNYFPVIAKHIDARNWPESNRRQSWSLALPDSRQPAAVLSHTTIWFSRWLSRPIRSAPRCTSRAQRRLPELTKASRSVARTRARSSRQSSILPTSSSRAR
jgi:3-hydroxyisobutyrate dehydrogenase